MFVHIFALNVSEELAFLANFGIPLNTHTHTLNPCSQANDHPIWILQRISGGLSSEVSDFRVRGFCGNGLSIKQGH